jgi:putative ABC transport system permease protein
MRLALRALARTPAFTAIAILTLAIGIGANTAIFAIVDKLIFEPVRSTTFDNVHRLVMRDPVSRLSASVQIPDYEALVANRPDGVAAIAAVDYAGGGLAQLPGRADRLNGWRVSGQFADVFQVRTRLGRWITDDDNAGGEPDPKRTVRGLEYPIVRGRLGADVVVISHRLWRDWFRESPDVVRTGTLTIAGTPRRVVGVAPAGFQPSVDVWTPFGARRLLTEEELDAKQPGVSALLRPDAGASLTEIHDRMTAIVRSRPSTVSSPTGLMTTTPMATDERALRTGYLILGFAALIFVAACANLGNMLFARAAEREGELAVRFALGASRLGIFKLLCLESILICAVGAAAGLLLAGGVLNLFTSAFPAFEVTRWQRIALDLPIDWRIAGYAFGAGLVAAILVGAGSLLRSSRVSLVTRLAASGPAVVAKTEGRTLRTMLTSVQVTAAVLLLITTGMLLENTSRRLNRRILYDGGSLVTARIELPESYDPSRGAHFYAQLLENVRALHGVAAAGLADALPAGEAPAPRRGVSAIRAEPPPRGLSGQPRRLDGQWIRASPGFIETLGLRVVGGRDFGNTDVEGGDPVAIVTASAASRLWPGEDPIGKRIWCCGAAYLRRVVGVVPDPAGAKYRLPSLSLSEAMQEAGGDTGQGAFVFLPSAQHYTPDMLVVVRSPALRADLEPLRQAVVALDPAVPVFDAGPAAATQFPRASSEQAVRVLAGALGAVALGIAVFGVYAIVSYFVSRRAREFGLRLALGATRGQIVKLVVDYAIHIVLIGLLPGVLFASLGTRYFQRELQNIHPNGLVAWVGVPLLMLAAGIVAAWLPARRAARLDPYKALKEL